MKSSRPWAAVCVFAIKAILVLLTLLRDDN